MALSPRAGTGCMHEVTKNTLDSPETCVNDGDDHHPDLVHDGKPDHPTHVNVRYHHRRGRDDTIVTENHYYYHYRDRRYRHYYHDHVHFHYYYHHHYTQPSLDAEPDREERPHTPSVREENISTHDSPGDAVTKEDALLDTPNGVETQATLPPTPPPRTEYQDGELHEIGSATSTRPSSEALSEVRHDYHHYKYYHNHYHHSHYNCFDIDCGHYHSTKPAAPNHTSVATPKNAVDHHLQHELHKANIFDLPTGASPGPVSSD
jgi:hypothetical protein